MNDQISKLIEELKCETYSINENDYEDYWQGVLEELNGAIKKAESQPPAAQWIPCSSGRMPEDGQTVVVTIEPTDAYRFMVVLTYHKTKPKRFEDNDWQGEGFYHCIWGDWIKRENIIAWMPAEPYKGVE